MMAGDTPCSANAIAPPALIDCPAISRVKKSRSRVMKNEHEGTAPAAVSQSGEATGWIVSLELMYFTKWRPG